MRFLIAALLSTLAVAQTIPTGNCFGDIPSDDQQSTIFNVVAAAVIGTSKALQIKQLNNTEFNQLLFPAGYNWTESKTQVTGLLSDQLTAPFFNGVKLGGTEAYKKSFSYSPVNANAVTGVCDDPNVYTMNYTGSLSQAMINASSTNNLNLNCLTSDYSLIEHFTTMVGFFGGCDQFLGDAAYSNQYVQQYAIPDTFATDVNVFNITAQYHRQMGLTAPVMNAFSNQVVAALEAHGVAKADYDVLLFYFNNYFYVGQYSLVSETSVDCAPGWYFNGNTTAPACLQGSSSMVSALTAVVVALAASLL